jgi:nitroimidazol reductase NimA-like FMN-containing flavoprotein (pyridoxamine 5'-phosphate oxidase superfamily)
MKQKAVDILDAHRLMAIATVRPDGWPQNTMVGYANEDILIYFVISRESQKFANIARDDRVSIVIGRDFHDPATIRALSIAAKADEVRDARQREHAIDLLLERHPGLKKLERPAPEHSAVMRANPQVITILDYSKGFGHADLLTVGPGGLTDMTPARDDDWGFGEVLKPVG